MIPRALALALAWALAVVAGRAEEPFSFERTPGKLPKDVVPRSYSISIRPDVATARIEGEVTVELEVLAATRAIVFNALEMEIPSAILDGKPVAAPRIDAQQETATLSLVEPLAAGRHELRLTFSARIGTQTGGLYSIKYTAPEGERVMLATQMEPTDARRMFPCWDEPAFRASFRLTTTVPAGQSAVSNMPVASERPLPDGRREVSFAPTPSMSSYLVVLCIGELEAMADAIDGLPLRIWTTSGKRIHAQYAMDAARLAVQEFNAYFGVKYQLPKLDLIAIPGGFGGAMENWGGIVFSEAVLLYDRDSSSEHTRRRIFDVVAHEIAHQWFGNLVTMAWWDNLWLNEGFASWMATKTTAKLNPLWSYWLYSSDSRESMMRRDARRGTHPIQQPVPTESAASDAFDDITYHKGQAFIRMLESHLGEDRFREGIRLYMSRHAYRNTTTADLWKALEDASGEPVAAIAEGWTTRPGFPVISVAIRDRDGKAEIVLEQEHFTANPRDREPLEWKIPVVVAPLGGHPSRLLMQSRVESLVLDMPRFTPFKLNLGNTGLYRASYSQPVADLLARNFRSLAEEDRLNLLSDTWAMVEAGRSPLEQYMRLLSEFRSDDASLPLWSQAIGNIRYLATLMQGTPAEAPLKRWAIGLLRGPFGRLRWDGRYGEPANDSLLRAALVEMLGALGDEAVVEEARKRFAEFVVVPEALAANLRSPVITTVGRHADLATWNRLGELARTSTSAEDQSRYYQALQSVRDEALARRTLATALSDEHGFSHWWGIVSGVARNHPDLAWEFARTHATALLAKIPPGGAFTTRNNFFGPIARASSNPGRASELERFVADTIGPDGAAEALRAAEQIRAAAAMKEKLLEPLMQWLENGPTPQAAPRVRASDLGI